jgi:hypothetical protein
MRALFHLLIIPWLPPYSQGESREAPVSVVPAVEVLSSQVPPRLACRSTITLSQFSGDFGQPSIEKITLRVTELRGWGGGGVGVGWGSPHQLTLGRSSPLVLICGQRKTKPPNSREFVASWSSKLRATQGEDISNLHLLHHGVGWGNRRSYWGCAVHITTNELFRELEFFRRVGKIANSDY